MKNIVNRYFRRAALAVGVLSVALLLPACDDEETVLDEQQTVTPSPDAPFETLRMMDYNILEGMKLDKEQNFDNFVAWVQKQNPDILALCECNHLTDASLAELAARYGHSHSILCKQSGFSVGLTSKHPIELQQRLLEDSPLWHGALHLKIKGINVVVLHLYPFGTYPHGEGAANSGNEYRDREITYILDNTIRRCPEEKHWILCGDFNSYSPRDAAYTSGYFGTHSLVLQNGFFDVLADNHNSFCPTVPTRWAGPTEGTGNRIDFIYTSKSIAREVVGADVIRDEFTHVKSDHYPQFVDFKYYPSQE